MTRHCTLGSIGLFTLLAVTASGCGTDRETYYRTETAAATSQEGGTVVTSPGPVASSTTAGSTQQTQAPPPGVPIHPVVLVHGIGGFAKLGPFDGFNQVPGHLRSLGVTVLVPQLTAFGRIEQRAQELRDQIVAAFPDPHVKVNLITHSMGGLDARAAIARYGLGDKVVSLTTIATPHQGSPVADEAVDRLPASIRDEVEEVLDRVGWTWASVEDLTTDSVQQVFNPSTPDDPRVYYQSYGAEADPGGTRSGTPIQPMLAIPWRICFDAEGANDGLVPVSSAKWGNWRGLLPTDHLGAVGHVQGLTTFDHLRFYAELVEDLATRGF